MSVPAALPNIHRVPVAQLGPADRLSPLRGRRGADRASFVAGAWVRGRVEMRDDLPAAEEIWFEKAGPREHIHFDPARCRAAIVTCGGLSPGLNNVIRSIFTELHFHYGVPEVLGIRHGYRGLVEDAAPGPLRLTAELVDDIHTEGGTLLGSSRGRPDPARALDYLAARGITQLFCVGGDGTQRGARELAEGALARGLDLAVVGIPKTIDNDVPYCDQTFGYSTAIAAARDVIEVAHVEAKGAVQGVGLVKLMGRDAGFIACGATVASQKVNFTLVPEQRIALDGPGGFLAALEARLDRRDHAIVVVAEGAGQEHFDAAVLGHDASGNRRYGDIGALLRERIVGHFRAVAKPVEVKYIDPSYMIRGIPANCDDGILCDQLARGAVHAAMAGCTGVMISCLNSCFIHVPIALAVGHKKRVDLNGPLWQSVLAATGQPAEFV